MSHNGYPSSIPHRAIGSSTIPTSARHRTHHPAILPLTAIRYIIQLSSSQLVGCIIQQSYVPLKAIRYIIQLSSSQLVGCIIQQSYLSQPLDMTSNFIQPTYWTHHPAILPLKVIRYVIRFLSSPRIGRIIQQSYVPHTSPWYNRHGWLGVKNQLAHNLSISKPLDMSFFHPTHVSDASSSNPTSQGHQICHPTSSSQHELPYDLSPLQILQPYSPPYRSARKPLTRWSFKANSFEDLETKG